MRALVSALLSFCLLLPARANDLPELGDASEAALSIGQERAIGYSIMRQIRASPNFLDDPDVTDYLNRVGYRLVSVSPDTRRDFTFFALKDTSVNAFALPGGYIGVHSGPVADGPDRIGAGGRARPRNRARDPASHRAHGGPAAARRHGIARGDRDRDPRGALESAGGRGRDRRCAGPGARTAARVHARQRARGGPRGPPDRRASGYDPHAMPVFLDRLQRAYAALRCRHRAFLHAHAPDHLRAHRRRPEPHHEPGVPPGAGQPGFPSGAGEAARDPDRTARCHHVLRRADRRSQVQQRDRRALRPRGDPDAGGEPEAGARRDAGVAQDGAAPTR